MSDRPRVSTGGDWASGIMDYPLYGKHGFRFAMRYIVPQISGKMISRSEIVMAHAAGIDLGFIYETDGQGWKRGGKAGILDGSAARMALMSVSAPPSCAAYFTVDSQAQPSDLGIVLDYLRAGAESVLPYRAGVYGQYAVIESAAWRMPELFRWQTMAWSNNQVSDKADMLQLGTTSLSGIQIDVNAAYQEHLGQWYADAARQPLPTIEREDMYGHIGAGEILSVPVPAGTVTKIMLYADTGLMANEAQNIRVAVHSASKGYSQIIEDHLNTNKPVTVNFQERDVDGISLSRPQETNPQVIGYNVI